MHMLLLLSSKQSLIWVKYKLFLRERCVDVAPKVMPPTYTMELQQLQGAWSHCLVQQILSYKTLFFSIVTTISFMLSPVICDTSHQNLHVYSKYGLAFTSLLHCWSTPSTASLCSHPLFGLHTFTSTNDCQWVPFFSSRMSSMTLLCFLHSSVSDTIVSLPLCCYLSHGSRM